MMEGRRREGPVTRAVGGAGRPPWRRQPGEEEEDWVVGKTIGLCGGALGEANWTEALSRENGAGGDDFHRARGRCPWHGVSSV